MMATLKHIEYTKQTWAKEYPPQMSFFSAVNIQPTFYSARLLRMAFPPSVMRRWRSQRRLRPAFVDWRGNKTAPTCTASSSPRKRVRTMNWTLPQLLVPSSWLQAKRCKAMPPISQGAMMTSMHMAQFGHWLAECQEKVVKNLWREQRQAEEFLMKDQCQTPGGSRVTEPSGPALLWILYSYFIKTSATECFLPFMCGRN